MCSPDGNVGGRQLGVGVTAGPAVAVGLTGITSRVGTALAAKPGRGVGVAAGTSSATTDVSHAVPLNARIKAIRQQQRLAHGFRIPHPIGQQTNSSIGLRAPGSQERGALSPSIHVSAATSAIPSKTALVQGSLDGDDLRIRNGSYKVDGGHGDRIRSSHTPTETNTVCAPIERSIRHR